MRVYQPGQRGDVELLTWYSQLVAGDDLQKLVGPSLFGMAAFLRHFTSPELTLWYIGDEHGWWGVAWCFPILGGGSWGLWLRPDKRGSGSREVMAFTMDTLALAVSVYPVLVNTTKQAPVVAKTERLGYTYLGVIPRLFEGEDCHVLYMTSEQFEPIYERWRAYYERRKDQPTA